ncbi:MAG: glycosyltransferase family 39 protein [Acidobacteriota bacterium]
MQISKPAPEGDRKIPWCLAIALFVLAELFSLNVYRAATQSITTDEAFSYVHFIDPDRFALLRDYSANVHFLHALLVFCSVKLFGLSELSLRLPSLLGCALYFSAVWKICRRRFGNRVACIVGVLLLTANPLIEDHMSASRGYGLGLALFAWAFYAAWLAIEADHPPQKHLLQIAILSALSATSNLTFLFPTAALMAVVAWMLWQRSAGVRPVALLNDLLNNMVGPWLVLVFVVMVIPLSRVGPNTFYFGAATIHDAVLSLVQMSGGGAYISGPESSWIGAALFIGCLALFAVLFRRSKQSPVNALELLTAGTFVVTAVGLVVGHVVLGLAYPLARTGIYLLFLGLLSGLWIGRWRLGLVALILLCIGMLHGIRTDRYQEWELDADNRQLAQALMSRHQEGESTRVFTSSFLDQSLMFYQRMYGLNWISEINSLDWKPGYDYVMLWSISHDELQTRGLRPVYTGPRGAILAVPK